MGRCKYCGRWVALCRCEHKECKANFWMAYKEIIYVTQQSVLDRVDPLAVEKNIMKIASGGHIPMKLMRRAVAKGLVGALSLLLTDHVLSEEEEDAVIEFMEVFMLTEEDADPQVEVFEAFSRTM